MARTQAFYQIKVILNHIKPSIWRRISVPGNLTLWQLHAILQVVMGWEESHLHEFKVQEKEYGDPQNDEMGLHPILDEHSYRLDRVIPRQVGFRFTYTYDFGDSWEHVLLVEKILQPEGGTNRPVCLAGKRAGPLEDSGGPFGYMELVEALKDPADPEKRERLEWAGDDFDPEAFDLDEINRQLELLAEADYQLEELFDYEDMEMAEALLGEDSEGVLASVDSFNQVFIKWMLGLPKDLQETCENLAIRKNYLFFLSYLRDHKVKGNANTGNLPLKALREINAGFDQPQPMEVEGHKVRSEEEVPDITFVHLLAYARELIDGGPQEYWTLTEEGQMFFEMPPPIQVLDIFLTWLLQLDWMISDYIEFSEEQETELRKAVAQLAARLPQKKWIGISTLMEQVAAAAGRQLDDPVGTVSGKEFWKMITFGQVIMPMLLFEIFEGKRTSDDLDSFEFRLTSLGSSLLGAALEVLNQAPR